jgi:YHS domain-containing protein
MSTYNLQLAMALAAALIPSLAWGQHEAHQQASTQASSVELTQCLRVQPVIDNIITAATSRAEAARLSNSPTEMRAAVESLQAALRDIRAQSAPCAAAAATTDPQAAHTMPSTPSVAGTPPAQAPAGAVDPHAGHIMPSAAPGATETTPAKPAPGTPSKPAASDPHAGHTMPSAAPTSKGTTTAKPGPRTSPKPAAADPHAGHVTSSAAPATKAAAPSKPAAPKPEASKTADPHAGHSAAQVGDKQRDPVNGLMVDPATATKTTYQGQTYYFGSEQSRKEFLENPAKFAKKTKG